MKKELCQLLTLACACIGTLSAEKTQTVSPQTVIDKAEETIDVLEARKNELSASYTRLAQQVQRLQFQANTYPSDSNQQRAELESVAHEYYDVLQTMILLRQLEVDSYDAQLKDGTISRAKKTSIRNARSSALHAKQTLMAENDKLVKDGFVKITD